jgi:hypothetical protein
MRKVTNLSLEKLIADHRENPSVDTLKSLFDVFELIAINIYKYFIKGSTVSEVFKNKKSTIRELVCICFLKMDRYKLGKGKAFNFFTTIMLGWLRQIYRTKKNYAELKVKYAEKIRNNKCRGKKLSSGG